MTSTTAASTPVTVAIDGPAGAGKSTVAKELARRLGFGLLDTGAIYRAVALGAQRRDLSWDDEAAVTALARELDSSGALSVSLEPLRGDPKQAVHVTLWGEDVSQAIRTPELSRGASRVSAIAGVRAALLPLQRRLGETLKGVVAEGRDIGTVVFPEASVKFFLTASAEVRAKRRYAELRERGEQVSYEQTLREVTERDRADRERAVAPLRQADDAHLIDCTDFSADEVVAVLLRVVEGVG